MARELLMVDPKEMEQLVRYYKGEITDNALLNKAARLAAETHALTRAPNIPDGIAVAKMKPVARETSVYIKKIRREETQQTVKSSKTEPEKSVEPTPKVKKKQTKKKTEVEKLQPLPGWEDWSREGRLRRKTNAKEKR